MHAPAPSKWSGLLARMAILAALGAVAGIAANSLRVDQRVPWRHDWARDVEVRAVQEGFALIGRREVGAALAGGSATVLDARPLADYDAGHIPGAMSLPVGQFDEAFAHMHLFLVPGEPIVIYCSGSACDESLLLGRRLRELGYTNLLVYAGGYADWRAAEEGAQP